MPRPRKCRNVCSLPKYTEFIPKSGSELGECVVLSVDEYETVRLIDYLGLTQEECGEFMGVARTTVQQIYTDARGKLAECLVRGLSLRIEGGDYRLCSSYEHQCGCSGCLKHRCRPCAGKNNF